MPERRSARRHRAGGCGQRGRRYASAKAQVSILSISHRGLGDDEAQQRRGRRAKRDAQTKGEPHPVTGKPHGCELAHRKALAADLGHQGQRVGANPLFGDFPIGNTVDLGALVLHSLAGGLHSEKFAAMCGSVSGFQIS